MEGKLIDQIKDIEDEPKPYESLRFFSNIIIGLGWIAIGGWAVFIMITYSASHSVIQGFTKVQSGSSILTPLLMVIAWLPGLLFGSILITMGQVFKILLDIRNDVHLTRRYIRRFGLRMARNLETIKNAE